MNSFSSKMAGEVHFVSFDFAEFLQPDEKINFASVDARVTKGKDPEYKSLVYGNVTVDGTIVSQRVAGGKAGTTYVLTATVETSKRQVLKVGGNIKVLADVEIEPEDFSEGPVDDLVVEVPAVEETLPVAEVKAEEPVEDLIEEIEVVEVKAQEMSVKHFSFKATEVKELSIDGVNIGRFSGYAATYDIDLENDQIVPGAFKSTIAEHLKNNRPVRMYYQHDSHEMIGGFYPTAMKEDANGLYVEGDINLDVQRGKEVYALAKQGVLSDMSIGYRVKDFELDRGVRKLKEISLHEISVVSMPMNPQAKITAVKSIDELKETIVTKSDLEKVLRDAGLSRSASKWITGAVDFKRLKGDNDMEANTETKLCEEATVEVIEQKSPVDSSVDLQENNAKEEDNNSSELVTPAEALIDEAEVEDPEDDEKAIIDLLTAFKVLLTTRNI